MEDTDGFHNTKKVIWNGSGDSVSFSEKLAWDLGKKPKRMLSSIQSVSCVFGKKRESLHWSYTGEVQ